jgi:hypothetical protein
MYVNDLIRALKEKCQHDDYLGWVHCLMLMDDTVIMATTRDKAKQKLKVALKYCREAGMEINAKKTQFMVINGTASDKETIVIEDVKINNCSQYVYLGAFITQDASLTSAIKAHCSAKQAHVVKFAAFVKKNADFPFVVKQQVFKAALLSAILYSCESWLSPNLSTIPTLYMAALKFLLGVRKTTPNHICLIEAGVSPCKEFIQKRQQTFLRGLIDERRQMEDDPFAFVWNLATTARTPCARYVNQILDADLSSPLSEARRIVLNEAGSRYVTYRTMINPTLETHPLYADTSVAEFERLITTRTRLGSHNLAVERGRWARVPRETSGAALRVMYWRMNAMYSAFAP